MKPEQVKNFLNKYKSSVVITNIYEAFILEKYKKYELAEDYLCIYPHKLSENDEYICCKDIVKIVSIESYNANLKAKKEKEKEKKCLQNKIDENIRRMKICIVKYSAYLEIGRLQAEHKKVPEEDFLKANKKIIEKISVMKRCIANHDNYLKHKQKIVKN